MTLLLGVPLLYLPFPCGTWLAVPPIGGCVPPAAAPSAFAIIRYSRHGRQPRPDAPGHHRGSRALRRRHQAAEPAAAGRELRPHDGSQRPAHPHAAVPLHGPARRHRHGLLRPGRIHRTGRAAPRAHALRQRRPPRPDARVDAFGRGPAAGLRPYFQIAGPPDQHRHGPDGHPRGDRRSRPQPQSLLK